MNIVFLERNSDTGRFPPPVKFAVENYSIAAVGGPRRANIRATGRIDDLVALLDWLRVKVRIDDGGIVTWWGYIHRVVVEYLGVRISADLDRIANRIAVAYTLVGSGEATVGDRETTSWAENATSIAMIGYKELLSSLSDSTATAAAAARDRALNDLAKARAGFEPAYSGTAEPVAMIECRGWWETLAWRYAPVPTNLALAYETIGSVVQVVGKSATVDKIYQAFNSGPGFDLKHIEVRPSKTGTPSAGITLQIYSDDGGAPDTLLASVTVAEPDIPETADWTRFTLGSAETLAASTIYWIGLSKSGAAESANYYAVDVDSAAGYAEDALLVYGSEQIAATFDVAFRLFDTSDVQQVAYETYDTDQEFERLLDVEKAAQAFDVGSAINLQDIEIYIAKVGTPADNVKVSICENPDDLNPGAELASQTISGAALTTSAAWVTLTLASPLSLVAGTSYFLVVERSGGQEYASYYTLTLDGLQGYGSGPFVRYDGVVWAEYSADMPFRLFDNTLVETSQQIKSLVTSFGQFLRRIRIEDASGITTESYRDGDTTAIYEIERLMMVGTSNNRRLLAQVNEDRSVRIYEQDAATSPQYSMDVRGNILDAYGGMVKKSLCPAGVWVEARDIIPGPALLQIGGLQPFFVEEAEYNAIDDRLSLQAANLPNPFDLGVVDG